METTWHRREPAQRHTPGPPPPPSSMAGTRLELLPEADTEVDAANRHLRTAPMCAAGADLVETGILPLGGGADVRLATGRGGPPMSTRWPGRSARITSIGRSCRRCARRGNPLDPSVPTRADCRGSRAFEAGRSRTSGGGRGHQGTAGFRPATPGACRIRLPSAAQRSPVNRDRKQRFAPCGGGRLTTSADRISPNHAVGPAVRRGSSHQLPDFTGVALNPPVARAHHPSRHLHDPPR